jgi:hypothetical protein
MRAIQSSCDKLCDMLTTTFLIAQFIGVIALTFSITIFQLNERSKMLHLGVVAAILYAIHFFLLGAVTGAILNLVSALRSFSFFHLQPNAQQRHGLLFGFIALQCLVTIFTWQGFVSVFALMGSIISTFSVWHQKPRDIRRWALASPPFYFVYDALAQSYPGMLIEIIVILSNLVGEYRFDGRLHRDRIRLSRAS